MEAAEEVEVQLDRRSLLVRVAAEVEVQSGGGGGLAMRVAIEVEVQLGSGSSIEEAAVVVYIPPPFSIPILKRHLFLVQEVFVVTGDPWFIIRIAPYSPHWNQCPYRS